MSTELLLEINKAQGVILANQDNMKADLEGLKDDIGIIKTNCYTHGTKICQIETGFNNHLSSHNNLRRFFLWPVATALSVAFILFLLKVIFHVF